MQLPHAKPTTWQYAKIRGNLSSCHRLAADPPLHIKLLALEALVEIGDVLLVTVEE